MTLDAVAALMLDEASPDADATVLVVDDRGGALCRALLERGWRVRASCDDVRDEEELPPGVQVMPGVDASALDGVGSVLLRLPGSLGALEEYAERIAEGAAPDLRLVAGGRVKHMTRRMNDVLGRSFDRVSASLGRQKSRVLHAAGPTPGPPSWPRRIEVAELGLTMVAHGGVFSADGLDAGTRLLLDHLPRGAYGRAVDLGSGTGLFAAVLARAGNETTAIDSSRAAVQSTAATATANGVEVEVRRADGLSALASGSVDLLAANPSFHRGTEKDSTPTLDMIADAGRVLVPGGELWLVFNSHLPYVGRLRRDVGRTRVVARNRHYTLACAVRG